MPTVCRKITVFKTYVEKHYLPIYCNICDLQSPVVTNNYMIQNHSTFKYSKTPCSSLTRKDEMKQTYFRKEAFGSFTAIFNKLLKHLFKKFPT